MSKELSRRGFLGSTAVVGAAAALPASATSKPKGLKVQRPQANGLDHPCGLESNDIRLSWQIQSLDRNVFQTHYAVEVATSKAKLRAGNFDVWDSGKIASDATFDIRYKGRALGSREHVWWQVTIWDNQGRTARCAPASWEMGLRSPSDWSAKWIAAETADVRADREAGLIWLQGEMPKNKTSRQFRLKFSTTEHAEVEVISIANSMSSLFIDGHKAVADPAFARLRRPPAISTKSQVEAGEHVVALTVSRPFGRALYISGPAAAFLVKVRFKDGRVVRYNNRGAVTSVDKPDGWMLPTFNDVDWETATVLDDRANPFGRTTAYMMRRTFTVGNKIARARLYVTALGAHQTFLNGAMVGKDQLTPEWTDFSQHVLYRVYDVTAHISPGKNAWGAHVGDGWYGSYLNPKGRYSFGPPPLRYLGQLELTFDDGSVQTIVTDEQWHVAPSPVLMSEIYDGEDYDAQREMPGWNTATFIAGEQWERVAQAPLPEGKLVSEVVPGIRKTRTLKPKTIKAVGADYLIDFGQNFAGHVKARIKGARGTKITLRFAEILKPDGTLDQSNLRGARAADSYILRGDPKGETFEPHFTFHGFRYVQISGLTALPDHRDFVGVGINSDLEETGDLRIGNPLITQLWQNTLWSQRSNFIGIPTDCPQRDERLGWLGDANVFWDAAAFDMNVSAFTSKWMRDLRDAQGKNGAYPDTAPNRLDDPDAIGATPGWSEAAVVLPWTVWRRYGDTRLIDEHWDSMTRYLDFIEANSENYIWTKNRGNDYGDWLSYDGKAPGDPTTPKDLVATAMWKCSTDAMADMATASNRTEAAAKYRHLSAAIADRFAQVFVKEDGTIGNDSQTSYILALHYDLVPDEVRTLAAAKLRENIIRRGNMLTTGFLGTPYSLDVLANTGFESTVYDLLLRTEYPSWGHMIVAGATTIWERWNADASDPSMNSYNHYALGAIIGFLFRRVAGFDPKASGFRTIEINPVLDPRVTTGGGTYKAVVGQIRTDWAIKGNVYRLQVDVPANCRAKVYLPAKSPNQVTEGKKAWPATGLKALLDPKSQRLVCEVSSGRYDFEVGRPII